MKFSRKILCVGILAITIAVFTDAAAQENQKKNGDNSILMSLVEAERDFAKTAEKGYYVRIWKNVRTANGK